MLMLDWCIESLHQQLQKKCIALQLLGEKNFSNISCHFTENLASDIKYENYAETCILQNPLIIILVWTEVG